MSDHPKTPRRIADDYVERVAAADPATSVGLGLHLDDDRQPDLDVDEAYAWAWSEFHRMLAQMRVEAGRCCPARPCWRRWGT